VNAPEEARFCQRDVCVRAGPRSDGDLRDVRRNGVVELADAADGFVVAVWKKERDERRAGEMLGDQWRDTFVVGENMGAFGDFRCFVYHLHLRDSSSAYQKKSLSERIRFSGAT
jgi:hypothetical protein